MSTLLSFCSSRIAAHKRSVRRQAGPTLLTATLALIAAAGAARAQEPQSKGARTFNITEQTLLSALDEFGEQSGLQVATSAVGVDEVQTRGVSGNYTPQQALDILLEGSGLNSEVDRGVAVIVSQNRQFPAASEPSYAASNSTLQSEAVDASETEDYAGEIETITVVGEATNSLVTSVDIETYQAYDLADVFRLTPSISVGGSVGVAQKIYVRGLEDSLINVTVDGAPQTSTLFHHIGRVTIDPDLLKQVEVQAGAGEATSGAGAIGGAIRFKTKDARDLLIDDSRFGGRLKVNEFTNNGNRYSAALYGRLGRNWGVLASYTDVEHDNMEDGDGNDILGTAAEQSMAFLKVSGDIGSRQHLSLSFESRDEEGQFSARPNWVVREGDPLYDSEAQRETFVANYGLKQSEILNLEATAYRTESSFRGGRFDWLTDISTVGFDVRNTSETGNHRFTYGVDFRDDKVESGFAIPQPEEDHAEEGSVFGLYLQGHSQVSDALLLSYGVRYDDYRYEQRILLSDYYGDPIPDAPVEIDNSEISLNAGLSYEITDRWTFGLGYAEASRGKEIGDGFTIDGYLYDGTDAPVVDPNLEAEKVSNIETSLKYGANGLTAKLAVFHSEIDDVIFERLYGNSFYQNIGTIETRGFEVDLAYRWRDFEVFLGFAANDSELDPAPGLYDGDYGSIDLNGYEFNGLGNSRGDTWNLGFDYTPLSNLEMGLNVSHVDELNIETLHQDFEFGWVPALHTLRKPSYTTVDAFAEWRANDNLVFNLAVINLLDERYRDHSSVGDYSAVAGYELVVGPLEAGRDVRLSASFSF